MTAAALIHVYTTLRGGDVDGALDALAHLIAARPLGYPGSPEPPLDPPESQRRPRRRPEPDDDHGDDERVGGGAA